MNKYDELVQKIANEIIEEATGELEKQADEVEEVEEEIAEEEVENEDGEDGEEGEEGEEVEADEIDEFILSKMASILGVEVETETEKTASPIEKAIASKTASAKPEITAEAAMDKAAAYYYRAQLIKQAAEQAYAEASAMEEAAIEVYQSCQE